MPRKLGQHFLRDANVLARIAEAACPSRVGTLLEIGPGRGALTAHLMPLCERMVSIEIDHDFIAPLKIRFPTLELVEEEEVPDQAEALRRVQEMLGAQPVDKD